MIDRYGSHTILWLLGTRLFHGGQWATLIEVFCVVKILPLDLIKSNLDTIHGCLRELCFI